MTRAIRATFVLVLSLFATVSRGAAQPPQTVTAFTHVNVVDVATGRILPARTVVVEGTRITAVDSGGSVALRAGTRVVDAAGRYLIPGLWDMHAHTLREAWLDTFLPLFIAHGVTGVRDMGLSVRDTRTSLDEFEKSKAWRHEITQGKRIGPRIVAAGILVDGPQPVWPFAARVANESEARSLVRDLKARGADFVKVYTMLPSAAYLAIADETRKQAMALVGHAPARLTLAQLSDAGQKSIEHLSDILLACSADEDQLRTARLKLLDSLSALGRDDLRVAYSRLVLSQNERMVDSYSNEKAGVLFDRFRRNGTWQVPTLVIIRAASIGADETFLAAQQDRLKYVPRTLRERWTPNAEVIRVRRENPALSVGARRSFEKSVAIVGEMNRAGVPILAGTDTPNPYIVPGLSLHDELELLVSAGLAPVQALRAATLGPATFLGLDDKLGSVRPGNVADLVLLDGNPLEDIRNTRRIAGVVVNGTYLAAATLRQMLADVEAVAATR